MNLALIMTAVRLMTSTLLMQGAMAVSAEGKAIYLAFFFTTVKQAFVF